MEAPGFPYTVYLAAFAAGVVTTYAALPFW